MTVAIALQAGSLPPLPPPLRSATPLAPLPARLPTVHVLSNALLSKNVRMLRRQLG